MNETEIAQAIASAFDRMKMLETLLHEVVERTGQQREGYYSLRKLNDLAYAGSSNFTGFEDYLQHLNNLMATFETEIARIEGLA